jgi:hypothetical protein
MTYQYDILAGFFNLASEEHFVEDRVNLVIVTSSSSLSGNMGG